MPAYIVRREGVQIAITDVDELTFDDTTGEIRAERV